MPYRNPNLQRIMNQAQTVYQYAGQTATWRPHLSVSADVSVAGFGSLDIYAERTITALFATPTFEETQVAAGLIAAGDLYATTTQRLGRQDELVWMGNVYRVDSDAVPAKIAGHWQTLLKRATP